MKALSFRAESIYYNTFKNTAIESITIPNGVNTIETGAFSECVSLTSIVIPRSVDFCSRYTFDSSDSVVIYCYENSYIHKLAVRQGWSYQLINDEILMGDVNGDDDIDINDVTCIQLHLAYIRTLSSEGVLAADVDGDGVISINDATKIQKYLVGIIKSL